MSAVEFIQYSSWVVYLLLFILVAQKAVRQPTHSRWSVAFLLSGPAGIVVVNLATRFGWFQSGPVTTAINTGLFLLMSYMLMRLAEDFAAVPRWISQLAWVGGLGLTATGFLYLSGPRPGWLTGLMTLYFFGCVIYATYAFARGSLRLRGVTRRRMQAVAVGGVLLILNVVVPLLPFPNGLFQELRTILQSLFGLGSGLAFFLGFLPPLYLQQAWREPELRDFFRSASRLSSQASVEMVVAALEAGAAASLGAARAAIGLWDEGDQHLSWRVRNQVVMVSADDPSLASTAFRTQKPLFQEFIPVENTVFPNLPREYGRVSLLAAPVSIEHKRMGVLAAAGPRVSIFAESDLELAQLLADQIAMILENRLLLEEASQLRAREEVSRLKEDFLSTAAHELKTPVTTLSAQLQLLQRRASRGQEIVVSPETVGLLLGETQRLKALVLDLLDTSRIGQGIMVGRRVSLDLAELVAEVIALFRSPRHQIIPELNGPAVGTYDRARISQMLDNLLENAIKYSPDGGEIHVKTWREGETNHLSVRDQGIGIVPKDLPHLFDRFFRGSNVDDRRFAGLGLGLYMCRIIAEEHGGRIEARSEPGQGTTFHVMLPAG